MTEEFIDLDIIDPTDDISELTEYKLGDNKVAKVENAEIVSTKDYEEDYEYAKNKIKEASDKTSELLQDVVALAKYSEHPRTYEVAAAVAKTLSDISKDLMELHDKRKKFKGLKDTTDGSSIETQNNTQNNFIFQGTEEELTKILNKVKGE